MSNFNLIVDDDYINSVKTYLNVAADDANKMVETLIETINRASTDSCISGKTAEALKSLADRVSMLSGVVLEYGKECSNLADSFLKEIDKLDGDLYWYEEVLWQV